MFVALSRIIGDTEWKNWSLFKALLLRLHVEVAIVRNKHCIKYFIIERTPSLPCVRMFSHLLIIVFVNFIMVVNEQVEDFVRRDVVVAGHLR